MTDNVNNTNNNVQVNKKTLKWVGIVIGAIIVLGLIGGGSNTSSGGNTTDNTVYVPTTMSVGQEWTQWKNDFLPVISQTITDYTDTQASLQAYDVSGSQDGFQSLSDDALTWSSYANSPNKEVNRLVTAVSVDLALIAGNGTLVLNGDTSSSTMSNFQSACRDFNNDTNALSNAIEQANSSY